MLYVRSRSLNSAKSILIGFIGIFFLTTLVTKNPSADACIDRPNAAECTQPARDAVAPKAQRSRRQPRSMLA